MIDPVTALYALLGGVGLVTADAYMSSSTIHLKTIVAPVYEASGFERQLVEALFLAELEEIIDADSIAPAPHVLSTHDKPVSSALADAAGLSHALDAAKSTIGAGHPTIILSVLADNQNGKEVRRIVIAGDTSEGRNISISIPLNDRSLDDALSEAAFKAMKEIDPYFTALHTFEVAEAENRKPFEAEVLINEAITRGSKDEVDPSRALLENLMGLTQLLLNDHLASKLWFEKALISDNSLVVATLNLAYVEAVDGNCKHAMTLLEPLLEPTYWVIPADKNILYPANNLLGTCASRLGRFDSANAFFKDAATVQPDGTSVYYYWAKSLLKEGKREQAETKYRLAQRNISRMDDVPEIAMLHLWLPDHGSVTLDRRQPTLPALETPLID
jgi:tetratricopeptide (TPR) repeat protein